MIDNLAYAGILDKSDSYKIQALDGRWAQKNFFKEAKVKVDIDHQMGYQFEAGPDGGEDNDYYVVNPEYALLAEEIGQSDKRCRLYALKKDEVLRRFQTIKRKVSLKDYLKQKGNKKVIDTYMSLKVQLSDKMKKAEGMEPKVKFSTLQQGRKDIIKTVRSSVILAVRASVYNMRKRFEEMAATCFTDHRELSKFVLSLTTSPATVTFTNNTIYVKLKKLETPVYQKSAEKFINILNKINTTTLDGTERHIVYQI